MRKYTATLGEDELKSAVPASPPPTNVKSPTKPKTKLQEQPHAPAVEPLREDVLQQLPGEPVAASKQRMMQPAPTTDKPKPKPKPKVSLPLLFPHSSTLCTFYQAPV